MLLDPQIPKRRIPFPIHISYLQLRRVFSLLGKILCVSTQQLDDFTLVPWVIRTEFFKQTYDEIKEECQSGDYKLILDQIL